MLGDRPATWVRAATQRLPNLIQWAREISGNPLETDHEAHRHPTCCPFRCRSTLGPLHPSFAAAPQGAARLRRSALRFSEKGLPSRQTSAPQRRSRSPTWHLRLWGIEREPAPLIEHEPAMPSAAPQPAEPRQRRTGTKQAQLIAMLEAPQGASSEEIVAAFGLAAAHGARSNCRRAQEEARLANRIRHFRGPRAGLPRHDRDPG